jgi:ribosomal protein L37AE/L43A
VPAGNRIVAWFAPPVFLGAVLVVFRLVQGRPVGVFGGIVAVLAAVPIAWVVISTLWPARADRTCPGCGRDTLRRLDRRSTVGLACRSCGWRDETQSSWLLAEEEGPLEEIVLRQRGRGVPAGADRERSAVDSPTTGD